MRTECPGWPAPHVPPIVLRDGEPPVSHGLCPACDRVLAITEAAPRTPRLARFVARLTADRLTPRITHSSLSLRHVDGSVETLTLEKLR